MVTDRPKTIFCDIDGVLFEHKGDICNQHLSEPNVLPGVLEKFKEWDRKGYKIILTTGRRESTRKETEVQLSRSGIFYDHLLMGITSGIRVVVNDYKENSQEDTAMAINVKRNSGIENIKV